MTAQLHEKLILDGKPVGMAFCPPLPRNDPRLVELTPQEILAHRIRTSRQGTPEREMLDRILGSTACWRRYQGTWEIKDGQLFLNSIEGRFKLLATERLLADWFTGVLCVPRREQLAYVHMGFGSVYAEELHIHVERGRVTGVRVNDNHGKGIDTYHLGLDNLPGGENRFPGDRDFN